MSSSKQNHRQIHAEIEDLEDLGFGQGKNQNPTKFSESDSTEHLRTETNLLNTMARFHYAVTEDISFTFKNSMFVLAP